MGTGGAAAPQAGQDRTYTGVLLMLGFCVIIPFGDATAKILGTKLPLFEILFWRFALQAVLLLPFMLAAERPALHGRLTAMIALRTGLLIGGMGSMYASLRVLPLADAVAIAFVMPFLLMLLAWLMLGESIGPRRLAACAAGFVGTMMVIKPSFVDVGAAALLPLAVAVFFAFFMLTTRRIAREIDPIPLQAISGLMAAAALLPVVLAGRWLGAAPAEGEPAGAMLVLLVVLLALIGTVAHLSMTWSLRFAPASTLAPMQYLEIPFATLVGWMVFGDLPDGMAALGIMVTIAAGLYVLHRERRAQAEVVAAAPRRPG